MQTASGAFAALMDSSDRLIDYKVTAGFPGAVQASFCDLTKCVVSISRNETLNTTLPGDTASIISGIQSSQVTIVLAGMINQNPGVPLNEADNVARLFNANDPTSPTYRMQRVGLTITIEEGAWDGSATAELVTTFTGIVDEVDVSNGVVTLTCLDNNQTVTGQASLPPVVTAPPYNAGLTSEFAIDYLFRHASPKQYYSWPALRAGCVFACGYRASVWPDVGALDLTLTDVAQQTYAGGAFGSSLFAPIGGSQTIAYDTTPITASQQVFIEAWSGIQAVTGSYTEIVMTSVDGNVGFQVDVGYGPSARTGVTLTVYTTGGIANVYTWSFSPTAAEHYCGVQFAMAPGSASWSATIYYDGTTHTTGPQTAASIRPAADTCTFAFVNVFGAQLEAVQITNESAGASNDGFAPTLILDQSLNSLTALPDVANNQTRTVLQDIAAAENGIIGFDNSTGNAYFFNRRTIATQSSARTLTSSKSLINVDTKEQRSLCATHVQVPVNQLQIVGPQTVWSASTVPACQPGTTVIYASTDNPALAVATTDSGYYPIGSPTPGLSYWRGCRSADGSGADVTTGISFTVVQNGTQLTITIKNTNPYVVYLCNGNTFITPGVPVLFVGGLLVTSTPVAADGTSSGGQQVADAQWPPARSGGAVTNPDFGEILLTVPANDWIQDPISAAQFAADLLSDFYLPRPLYRNVAWTPDPRIQIGDRVTLQDPDVSQVNNDVITIGLRTALADGQYTQEADVLACYAPGDWILDDAVYSVLDVTTYT